MTASIFDNEILKYLSLLEESQQAKVLAFLKALVQDKNAESSQLLLFAGSISADDLKQMKIAIDEGCEHIDAHEW